MGFSYRKSIKVMPGVKLNVSKKGVGYSMGGKRARVTKRADGRTTRTVNLSSGMSHTKTIGKPKTKTTARPNRSPSKPATQNVVPDGPAAPPKPGMLSPKGEKQLHAAITKGDTTAMVLQANSGQDEWALLARMLGGLSIAAENPDLAVPMLAAVLATGKEPAGHPFIQSYARGSITVDVAEGVSVTLPIGRDAVGLVLAELLQDSGDIKTAATVVEQLEPTTIAAVSLAELYLDLERWQDVVELTDGLSNEDDPTNLLCVFRGVALRELGHFDAARLTFKEALKSKKREPVIRHRGLVERSRCYQAEGKNTQARKDLETVLAEDSTYEGVRELLSKYVNPHAAVSHPHQEQTHPTQSTAPPGWHPDPHRRYQYRWWDGNQWTTTVATNGTQSKDPTMLA